MCGRNVLLTRTCWEPFSPSASRLNGREKVTGCTEKKGKFKWIPLESCCTGLSLRQRTKWQAGLLSHAVSIVIHWHLLIHCYSFSLAMKICSDVNRRGVNHVLWLIQLLEQLLSSFDMLKSRVQSCIGQISLVADYSPQTMPMTCRHPLVAGYIIAHWVTFISRKYLTSCEFIW